MDGKTYAASSQSFGKADRAAVGLDNFMHDGQSESAAMSVAAVAPIKTFENVRAIFG